jgi:hypothetical protein
MRLPTSLVAQGLADEVVVPMMLPITRERREGPLGSGISRRVVFAKWKTEGTV